jgi:hypothetical membrane protein
MNTNTLTISDINRISERSDRVMALFIIVAGIAVFLFIVYLTRRKDSNKDGA